MVTNLYIGLMSGTSLDGIDAVLVNFDEHKPHLIATLYQPYDVMTRAQILKLTSSSPNEIENMGRLDVNLAQAFANLTNQLLAKAKMGAKDIVAIGSHGQTIRHMPHPPYPFTLQIGDPNTIAALTNITTVADFRRKDIAYGGQGAPLVPLFHQFIFSSSSTNRIIVNIGGIANITCLIPGQPLLGYDTGPGNILLDAWVAKNLNLPFDEDGAWGNQGNVDADFLEFLLSDPYFSLTFPKSTGREYFNLPWLEEKIKAWPTPITPHDIQATLIGLTAKSILLAAKKHCKEGELILCGGGAYNKTLLSYLSRYSAPYYIISTTHQYGLPPEWVEATAFAWLAKQTIGKQFGNHPHITGAKTEAILGGIYYVP